MRAVRVSLFLILGVACFVSPSRLAAQVTINEYIADERTAGFGQVNPDTREFVELYNAGAAPVDISGWSLTTKQLGANFNQPAGTKTYTIPASQTIPAGGYYVIGAAGVPNVNFTPTGGFGTGGTDLFPDGVNSTNAQHVLELRNTSSALIDALANETFRGSERANITSEQSAQVGGGLWGQDPSINVSAPNVRMSISRFVDGRDTNVNGRDFGMLPLTPGASNNLPQNAVHTIPNVDAAGLEDPVTQYMASFVLPRAIDPANNDGNAINPKAIPASPQGGKAIIAYDETGGGNAFYSKELVQKFDLYAYIDTGNLSLVDATTTQHSEVTVYGIGTTDGIFGTPNPAGSIIGLPANSSQNSSTGYGWMIERVENYNGGSPTTTTKLLLYDAGDGGDSTPSDHEWELLKTYDLTGTTSDWYRLSIEHDPVTGIVTAKRGVGTGALETTTFTVPGDYNNDGTVNAADYIVWRKNSGTTNVLPNDGHGGTIGVDQYTVWQTHFGESVVKGVLGTFYGGYRESLGGSFATARPATFDMIGSPGAGSLATAVPEPGSIGLALIGIFAALAGRRRDK